MKQFRKLSHSTWDCKYHVVFIPKCRKKILYGQLPREISEILKMLAKHKESENLEGHTCSDHIYILTAIPSKYVSASVIVYMKGKSFNLHSSELLWKENELWRS